MTETEIITAAADALRVADGQNIAEGGIMISLIFLLVMAIYYIFVNFKSKNLNR